jgi:hypothetical protein
MFAITALHLVVQVALALGAGGHMIEKRGLRFRTERAVEIVAGPPVRPVRGRLSRALQCILAIAELHLAVELGLALCTRGDVVEKFSFLVGNESAVEVFTDAAMRGQTRHGAAFPLAAALVSSRRNCFRARNRRLPTVAGGMCCILEIFA